MHSLYKPKLDTQSLSDNLSCCHTVTQWPGPRHMRGLKRGQRPSNQLYNDTIIQYGCVYIIKGRQTKLSSYFKLITPFMSITWQAGAKQSG